ncbi:hypothetical protein [Parabacteroides goldsteinii]|uniref:hypothetical protein n=1 Tax=Parabacteroides goldsteinii TaxID=328812 RepID=UPI0034E5F154
MKNDSSYGLIGILMVLLIFISGGYWYSCSLRTQVTEIWKQTLWEDRTNRMREAKVKKIHVFTPTASPEIKITTEGQTVHLKGIALNLILLMKEIFWLISSICHSRTL